MNQWLDPEQLEPDEPEDPRLVGRVDYQSLRRMNTSFVAAMAAAIRAGLERPPRVGIDRTPGTKNPSYVPHGASNLL